MHFKPGGSIRIWTLVFKELSSRKVMGDGGEYDASWWSSHRKPGAERTTVKSHHTLLMKAHNSRFLGRLPFLPQSKKKTAETFNPTALRQWESGISFKTFFHSRCSICIKTQILKMTTEYENCFSSNGESKTICFSCLRMQSARGPALRLKINPLSLKG